MAGFTERIKIIIDVATGNSPGAIKDLRSELANTEGGLNKLKVTGSAAMDGLKQNIAGFAMAGGAALVSFAAKAVSEFQNLALAAGQFADATGIGTEAASRWIEVAGDVGVEAGAVEGALLKMERAAASTPEAFRAMGVEIARTQSGAVDANETFIRTLERLKAISDPAQRAAAGTKLLGKSWAEMAEIVESNDIRGALEGVSDAKVIDAEEVEKARRFREALDRVKGIVEDLALTVGEELVPAVSEATESLAGLAEGFGNALGKANEFNDALERATDGKVSLYQGSVQTLTGAVDLLRDRLTDATIDVDGMGKVLPKTGAAADRAADEFDDLGDSVDTTAVAAKVMEDQYRALHGVIDDEQALLDIIQGFDDLRQKFAEAGEAAKGSGADQKRAMLEAREGVLKQKDAVLSYLETVHGIPASKTTEIQAAIDRGDFDEAENLLALLTRPRTAPVRVRVEGEPRQNPGVGERIIESFGRSPFSQSPASVPVINLTVNVGIATHDIGRTIAEELGSFVRRSGAHALSFLKEL